MWNGPFRAILDRAEQLQREGEDGMKRSTIRAVLAAAMAAMLTTAAWAMPQTLVAVGRTVGIRLETDGILISELESGGPAEQAGLRAGDVIEGVNGTEVHDCETFQSMLQSCDGQPLTLAVERSGVDETVTVSPQKTSTGCRLGLSVRDSMAGIGTVTYYDPVTGTYGALGHGVNDLKTLVLLPVESGDIPPSSAVEARTGVRGPPGLLKGAFDTSTTLGTVERNTDHGIFGQCGGQLGGMPLTVAEADEVETGKAVILSNVRNTDVVEYEVEITRINPDDSAGRDLVLTVTDDRLLQTTGGIVQGMSGSPIIQNGKLVGAVTHVLVDEPTRGYGILIENMLAAGE